MKTEEFVIKREHRTYSLEFRTGRAMRWNSYGKCFPMITQCLLFVDGEIKAYCEVIKHELDQDNPQFARALVAKMAFKKARFWKELRQDFWNAIGHPEPVSALNSNQ